MEMWGWFDFSAFNIELTPSFSPYFNFFFFFPPKAEILLIFFNDYACVYFIV